MSAKFHKCQCEAISLAKDERMHPHTQGGIAMASGTSHNNGTDIKVIRAQLLNALLACPAKI